VRAGPGERGREVESALGVAAFAADVAGLVEPEPVEELVDEPGDLRRRVTLGPFDQVRFDGAADPGGQRLQRGQDRGRVLGVDPGRVEGVFGRGMLG
jgi:hypothetical protein